METEEKGKTLAVVQDEAPVYVPRICSWVDLSLTDVERLLEASATTEELQRVLCEILGLEDYGSSKEASIEVDLYFYAISSAKRNNFTAEQISAFFTILKSVHSMCKSTPYDNFQEVFQFFKELMVRHSISRPPFSICLFNMEQVKDITDYVLKTYFKHFKLYKYAFTKQVVLDLRLSYSGVPDTPEPPVGSEVELVETMDDVVTEEAEAQQENVEESGEAAQPPVTDDDGGEKEDQDQEGNTQQQNLKSMVAANLAEQMKQLQATVNQELATHEKKLTDRVSALEARVAKKGK